MAKKTDYRRSRTTGSINPYTFVPLSKIRAASSGEKKDADAYYANKSLHTGVFQCCIQIRTPLAIPDPERAYLDSKSMEKGHWCYPFYKIGENYAIPGSSIRGMLRSVYETITDSCFSTIKDEQLLSRRNQPRAGYRAGILIKDKQTGRYKLYQAARYLVPIDEKAGYTTLHTMKKKSPFTIKIENGIRMIAADGQLLKTGDKVKFRSVPSDYEKNRHLIWDGIVEEISREDQENKKMDRNGYVFVGEVIGNKRGKIVKHGESIFEKRGEARYKNTRKPIESEVLAKAYDRLRETLSVYRNESVNRNLKEESLSEKHYGYQGMEYLNVEEGVPLWYEIMNENQIHFSYAAVGRVIDNKSLNDLIGKERRDRCRDRNKPLCEACLLFGLSGGSREEAGMGSRIRIMDALADGKDKGKKLPMKTLKELGAPRVSYLPFYARKSDGKIPESYDESGVEISGRKYYWHNKKVNEEGGRRLQTLSDE